VHTLSELGLDGSAAKNKSNAVAVSEVAFTKPFRLLSAEGVEVCSSFTPPNPFPFFHTPSLHQAPGRELQEL